MEPRTGCERKRSSDDQRPGPSVFEQIFDVAVVGSGYAGFAAALALRRAGRRVLLIGARGDLIWESGRGYYSELGESTAPEWIDLLVDVARRGAAAPDWIDGAVAEIVATEQLVASGASVLYYARPVAVESSGPAITALIVATKDGIRRVAARRWVDATESGEVLRLVNPQLVPMSPMRTQVSLLLQHPDWSIVPGAVELRSTCWATERLLTLDVDANDSAWRDRVLVALTRLEQRLGPEMARISLSHLSVEPVSQYGAGLQQDVDLPNVICGSPTFSRVGVSTLSDRLELGRDAAARALASPPADSVFAYARACSAAITPRRRIRADVCVVGAGTGGAAAALAAATAEADVVCLEPLAFVGGIGTGGGIHGYWFGVSGGMQQTIDARVRELMRCYHCGPLGDGPFNPWAKMIVLEQLLRERAVDTHLDAMVFGVEKHGGRVVAVLAATPDGVIRVEADAFVDGTGDGDLCALAGASYTLGREHDRQLHAYSQSSGRLKLVRGRPRMDVVNFDAGFCDPTDADDLTRARTDGVRHYLLDRYDNLTRPTYIAPALGLRQGRLIRTEYALTLDDHIRRRRFDDVIGFAGSHYDNHATDVEFESDEAVFWVWANRQFNTPVACEMSYGMLVPQGLENVWIGSRCLGVSQDAQYITRMQRDMQRAGEAAGFAAAVAVRNRTSARSLPYEHLRRWLESTGALDHPAQRLKSDFGTHPFGGGSVAGSTLAAPSRTVDMALACLDRGEPCDAMWWLYKHRELVDAGVRERLGADPVIYPLTSWLAASIIAMWGDAAAQPRLISAIEQHEYGFDDHEAGAGLNQPTPLTWNRLAPHWLSALALLRRCGTADCLSTIERVLALPTHSVDTLATIAITIRRLAERQVLDAEEARTNAAALLGRVLKVQPVGAWDCPGRDVGRVSELALRGQSRVPGVVEHYENPPHVAALLRQTERDALRQLHTAVRLAQHALESGGELAGYDQGVCREWEG